MLILQNGQALEQICARDLEGVVAKRKLQVDRGIRGE